MSSSTAATAPTSPDAGRLGPLVLRAAGGGGQGIGHVTRSIALGEAWVAAGGAAVLAVDAPALDRARRLSSGLEVVAAPGPPPADADWLAVDGYELRGPEADPRHDGVARRIRIDDHGRAGDAAAAVIVDQGPDADAGSYPGRPAGVTLCLGTRYALLRGTGAPRAPRATPARLLVLLGGDPDPASVALLATSVGRFVDANKAGAAIDVLGGGDLAPFAGLPGVGIHGFVEDLAPFLAGADVALAAAGTTTWSLCRAGVPSVLVATVNNQVPVAAATAAAGAALAPAPTPEAVADGLTALWCDREHREAVGRAAIGLVDGQGAPRVVAAIRSREVMLRPVGPGDVERLWHWANDPVVRASAWTTDPIPWEQHRAWFDRGQVDPRRSHHVADGATGPWGQVRFDLDDEGVAVVSVSVAAEARGQGRAAPLLRAATRRLFTERADVRRVRAEVRPENHRSAAAFDLAGYRLEQIEADRVVYGGEAADGW